MKQFIISFFKIIFLTIKGMKTWRGILSLFLSFFIFYGWLLLFIFIGTVFKINYLIYIGSSGIAFWAGPFTPFIPLMITFSLLIQRYILFDKSNIISLKRHIVDLKNSFYFKKSYIKKIHKPTFRSSINKCIELENEKIREVKDDIFIKKAYIEKYHNSIKFYKKI